MNTLLFYLAFILLPVNFLAIIAVIIRINDVYKFSDSSGFIVDASALGSLMSVTNAMLVSVLDDANKNGLSLLLQAGILIVSVLLIKIFDKIDYKRNLKPNLQIKL